MNFFLLKQLLRVRLFLVWMGYMVGFLDRYYSTIDDANYLGWETKIICIDFCDLVYNVL